MNSVGCFVILFLLHRLASIFSEPPASKQVLGFRVRILGETERHEKADVAVLSHHYGLERIDVQPTSLPRGIS
jgi:hypothetical protein